MNSIQEPNLVHLLFEKSLPPKCIYDRQEEFAATTAIVQAEIDLLGMVYDHSPRVISGYFQQKFKQDGKKPAIINEYHKQGINQADKRALMEWYPTARDGRELLRIASRGLESLASTTDSANGTKTYNQLLRQKQAQLLQQRNAFVTANVRLTLLPALSLCDYGVGLLDLVQEGSIGMVRAIELYRPQEGNKFSTYTAWWIRQAMLRAINDQQREVRIPIHLAQEIRRDQREEWQQTDETTPGENEEHEQLQEASACLKPTISLDGFLDESGTTLIDRLEDQTIKHPLDRIIQMNVNHRLEQGLRALDPKTRATLLRNFGFDGEEESLQAIGNSYSLSRERMRQIKVEGLKAMRRKLQDVEADALESLSF